MQLLQEIVLNYILMPLLLSLITAFMGWAAVQWQKWTGQQIEAKQREALQSALENGIRFALQKLLARQPGASLVDLTIGQRDLVLREARGYVESSVPGALNHVKVGPEMLDTLLTPKLPLPLRAPSALPTAIGASN